MEIKISIITPCYNSASFIERTIGSVLSQTYENWEMICVNDGSTDTTLSILEQYANQDNRIKVHSKDHSGSASSPINYALQYVVGEYIYLLGHDDTLSSNLLEETVKRAHETDADIIIPDALIFYPEDTAKNFSIIGIHRKAKNSKPKEDRSVILAPREGFLLSLYWHIHAFGLYRASLLKDTGFNEEGMNGDEYTVREIILKANKVVFSEGVYCYYQNVESITKKLSVKYFTVFKTEENLHRLLTNASFEGTELKRFTKRRIKQYCNYKRVFKINKDFLSENEIVEIKYILDSAFNVLPMSIARRWIMKIKEISL